MFGLLAVCHIETLSQPKVEQLTFIHTLTKTRPQCEQQSYN